MRTNVTACTDCGAPSYLIGYCARHLDGHMAAWLTDGGVTKLPRTYASVSGRRAGKTARAKAIAQARGLWPERAAMRIRCWERVPC